MKNVSPWLVVVALAIGGLLAPILGPIYFGLSAELNAVLSGTMGGALLGAAGAVLGSLIGSWRQREDEKAAKAIKVRNMKRLITAELVNVAMGLIASKKTMDIALSTVEAGGVLPQHENFEREMPRSMPLTDALGSDLLNLDEASIDALVTLKSNLERTGEGMFEISSGRWPFGSLAAGQLSSSLGHDMSVLAECFERFAPERKFKLNLDSEPELASVVLRRFAQLNLSRAQIGL